MSAQPAAAVACSGQVRYASSSNTIYVTSGTVSLSTIASLCPSAPLTLVDAATHLWELRADLIIQNGATLSLHGTSVSGGDVDTLRLRSLSDNAVTHVSAITAQYGTIDINGVHITSWDDAAGAPDTDPMLPDTASSTDRARAFIRALSYLDTDGTPRESRMDITDSDIGYLGWHGAEAYGVSYKGRGCDSTHLSVCAALNVYGSETDSRFHDNFMGTYTFDAYGMTFDNNEYDHNVMYGLDPHDDSDYLTITHNHSHDNGDHGIICSQRCDHLEIAYNEVDHNGIPPYVPPGDDDASDNQVHGIMIHRGVTDSVIEYNNIHDQPNGAGIAVFDSSNDIIRNNTVSGAEYGLRYSVGSSNITTSANTVTNSSQYAVFTYQGTDIPAYTNSTGRPTGLTFTGNTFTGSGSNAVKLNQSDGTVFTGNTFSGTFGSGVLTQYTTGTLLSGNTAPTSLGYSVKGDSTTPGSITFKDATAPTQVTVDSVSSAAFTSTVGTVYKVAGYPSVGTALTTGGSTSTLTLARVGSGQVTVTPLPLAVKPGSGTATARVPSGADSYETAVTAGTAGSDLAFTASGLTPGATYTLTADGTTVTSGTANASGALTLHATAASTSEVDYRLG
ncbi:right-handed parallel beta-helix repeat-containing protein [Streptomyces sp. NBC_01262]|uniref:right-handed parallel beta-helix repeat-containing protein n=1 Tax=Streptomyces sp. NBC_01262 TaxID=2903803 RepID=UPI002E2F5FEF|nr:right-handed parallel beta-helix repeat-containing protein [Streptomyces sp. NBC_01262]